MKIPSLPTDNLYKFLALFGLVLFITGLYFFNDLEKSTFRNIDELKIREALNEYAGELKLDSVAQFEIRQDSIRIKHDINVLSKDLESFKKNMIGYFVILIFGGLLSVFGFGRWYYKLQKFQDRIIENEATKYSNEHWAYINKAKFDKEYSVYEDLWISLIKLKNATLSLRTNTESLRNEPLTSDTINIRAESFFKAHKECYELFENNKPFYSNRIYASVDSVLKLCQSEFVDFSMGGFPNLDEYWQNAQKNSTSIIELINKVGDSISQRLNNVEIIDKSS